MQQFGTACTLFVSTSGKSMHGASDGLVLHFVKMGSSGLAWLVESCDHF